MASSVIHMTIAHKINEELKKDKYKILIGSIAPDISKLIGRTKEESHFLDDVKNDIPNMERFLKKYQKYLDDDFVLGYYIHLYTDYLWFKYFIPEIKENDFIKKLDQTVVKVTPKTISKYIYNDYTNLNEQLIDKYNLELDIFYNAIPPIANIIKEIPMDKLNIIVDKAGVIISNSRINKEYVFNLENIDKFIETSTQLILAKINEIIK